MKRMIFALAALALSACSTVSTTGAAPPPASAVPTVIGQAVAKADTVILTGERAFAVAELAYTTAAKAIGIAADAGLIRGATATRLREMNREAGELLKSGKATADAADRARSAARLLDIADAIDAITGRK